MSAHPPVSLGQPVLAARLRPGAIPRRVTTPRPLVSCLLPAALLVLWWAATRLEWVSAQILPAPVFVFDSFAELARNGDLSAAMRISLERISAGFALGACAGLVAGLVLGNSQRARDYAEPMLKALFAIPSIGWIPILILIFGVDETVKVLIIAKAVFVPIVINTSQSVRSVPTAYIEAARVLRLPPAAQFLKLTLPASLPTIFTGIRLALSHAFIALVVVEMLAATEGIGYLMVWGRKLFQIDVVIVGMVLVGLIGLALDRVLRAAQRSLGRWGNDDVR